MQPNQPQDPLNQNQDPNQDPNQQPQPTPDPTPAPSDPPQTPETPVEPVAPSFPEPPTVEPTQESNSPVVEPVSSPEVSPAPAPTPNTPFGTATGDTAPQPAPQQTGPIGTVPPTTAVQPVATGQKKPFPVKIVIIIVSIILGLAIVGGGAYAAIRAFAPSILPAALGGSISTETYTNEALGFSIDAPKDWLVEVDDELEFYKSVRFTEPASEPGDDSEAAKHYASLMVALDDSTDREYSQTTKEKYFDDVKKLVNILTSDDSTASESYEYSVESSEATTVNGLDAYKMTLKATDIREDSDTNGESETGYWLYIFVDESTQYELRLTHHQSEAAVASAASAILNSFKVLN